MESISTMATWLVSSASRQPNGRKMSPRTATMPQAIVGRRNRCGSGTLGSRFSVTALRPGSRDPMTNRAITTSRNSSSWSSPGSGVPWSLGNQVWTEA